jgi:protein-L-isoaspartate(D-aspartate) O-methyltransferase
MIREIKEKYYLNSPGVFFALLSVPREKFVPKSYQYLAYSDGPISIGYGQTISQPYTVAFMTHLLIAKNQKLKDKKVLEIGTGSGYQAAVLSFLFKEVYTIERIRRLADRAGKTLKKLGYKNVFVKEGDGGKGWPAKAPFDAIMITASIKKIPKTLFNQLKENGVLIAPIGGGFDSIMTRFTKKKGRIKKEEFGIFSFVPFIKSFKKTV